jgi:VWFA-related protein
MRRAFNLSHIAFGHGCQYARRRKQPSGYLNASKPRRHSFNYSLSANQRRSARQEGPVTRGLLILHDFTQDSTALVDAVSHFTSAERAAFDASNPEKVNLVRMGASKDWYAFQNALNNVNSAVADEATLDRVRITTAAIEAIADHVAAVPGRKSLIWISEGFPIQIGTVVIGRPDDITLSGGMAGGSARGSGAGTGGSPVGGGVPPPVGGGQDPTNRLNQADRDSDSLAPAVSRAALALNRVNMVMYPIDAHGVEIDVRTAVDQQFETTAQDSSVITKEQELRDTSKQLADQTGGLAFFGNNDIDEALRRVMQDSQSSYTIGFYPDHDNWNGKFRQIRVSVNTDGARLRYRKGYFALPYQADTEKLVNLSLQEAALSPLEATGLQMVVEGKTMEPLSTRGLQLCVDIDPKQLLLQEFQGKQNGAIDLLFVQRDSTGKALTAEKLHLDLKLPQAQYEYLAKVGIVLEHHLTLSPQSTEIGVIVRDVGSGAIGSTDVPVKAFFPTQ